MTVEDQPVPVRDGRPRAAGKFLEAGGRKLEARGVTYGTFRPNRFGQPYPEPAVVRRDFAGMAATGFNAVRTYTVPPSWVLDEAAAHGLWMLVGVPWEQHVAFLDQPGRAALIRARIRTGVAACAGHPALLGIAIGNEIPAPIVRWSGRRRIERYLRGLYEVAKEVDPDALVTYVNYPSTEYLELPFLDFCAYNVYLESLPRLTAYVARLQNLCGDRPLLMAELGLDSRRNGESEQARLLPAQVRVAADGGCAGSFVFAWTDEWHRGGVDVDEWDFGLTTRERTPKPALAALGRALREPRSLPGGRWPSISVVVCAYNAERTLEDCLDGLNRVEYPAFEVIVVDDGSTDATADIASRHDVRLIRTENGGLSRARNTGIGAARGEIVAFIDADARPDVDWLTHLAHTFESTDCAGAGGPNIAPPGDGEVAACVGQAPGGPIHVLRTDREAEHVPGCNMAFRRSALLELGGFDPRFRVAGDDVDICWRLHERGWRIAFNPGAVVWHHARDSVRAYWRQQCGYGAAEALLEAKWPEKYNVAGHVTWGGRVYGPGTLVLPWRRGRIYGGTWGQAPFQRLEAPAPGLLWDAAAMPEWHLALGLLSALSLLGLVWSPLLLAVPLLLLGVATTVARALVGAAGARIEDPLLTTRDRLRQRAILFALHLLQPLARLKGRFLRGLVPWRARARHRLFIWPTLRRVELWRERGGSALAVLQQVERRLSEMGCVVRRDSGYDAWDLEVEGGAFGAARLRSCAEWHEKGRQLLRFDVRPAIRATAWTLILLGGSLVLWGIADGAALAPVVLGAATLATAARTVWECGTSAAAALEAVGDAVAAIETELVSEAELVASIEEPASAAVGGREWMRAAG